MSDSKDMPMEEGLYGNLAADALPTENIGGQNPECELEEPVARVSLNAESLAMLVSACDLVAQALDDQCRHSYSVRASEYREIAAYLDELFDELDSED